MQLVKLCRERGVFLTLRRHRSLPGYIFEIATGRNEILRQLEIVPVIFETFEAVRESRQRIRLDVCFLSGFVINRSFW